MKLSQNVNLKPYNTFGIECYCNEMIEIEDDNELLDLDFSQDFFILGFGSNILLSKNLNRVIKFQTKKIQILSENSEQIRLKVDAGVIWDEFVNYSVSNNYYGIENLSAIPGTVGACPIQNIGAYGAEVKDVIDKVEYFDVFTKQIIEINNKNCNFSYRNSIFKQDLKNRAIITSVTFMLQKNEKINTNYADIKNFFGDKNPNLFELRQAIISIRESKLPDYKVLGNCGSFYQNAIVEKNKLLEIQNIYENVPFFDFENKFKIPTAWLIEKTGLKAYKQNKVGISEKHALIIVNYGEASGKEILKFSEFVESKVFDTFGIKIDKEVNII